MDYEVLLDECDKEGLNVKEKPLITYDGRIKGNRIAIRNNMITAEKYCTLAEELGHYHTTSGDIIDQSSFMSTKQERRARAFAYDKVVGLIGFVTAYESGCQNRYEMAETLGVTEEFLQEAIDYYRSKYGLCARIDNYTVYFDPTGVAQIF